jgi:chemotaxis protein CheC
MRLSAIQEDAIREIISIGIGRAAASLSELIGTRIEMGVPRVSVRMLYEAVNEFAFASSDRSEIVVMQDFRGLLTGRSMLVLPQASGLSLAQLLAETSDPVDELDLELTGILTEVGSILVNNVLVALANLIGTRLIYSLPQFYRMRPVNLLKSHSPENPGALIAASTEFRVRSREIHGSLLVVMELRGLEAVLDAIINVGA